MSSILANALVGQRSALEDFLVEFYVYVSTLSLVSLDPKLSMQFTIHETIEAKAHALAGSPFVGSLCGCWIELLLLIPRVNTFVTNYDPSDCLFLSAESLAERFSIFATLQAEILSWVPPDKEANPALWYSGFFYREAVLLYLYTGTFQPSAPAKNKTLGSDLIDTTVESALAYLDGIPSAAQNNTLLCWPLAIVGSCISDQEKRNKVRQRLQDMKSHLGIGNINDILDILDALWSENPEPTGPWGLHGFMKSHNLCFSFA